MDEEQQKLFDQIAAMHKRTARRVAKRVFVMNTRMRFDTPALDHADYWERALTDLSRGVTTACETHGIFDRHATKLFRLTAYAAFEDATDALDAEFPDGVPDWAVISLNVIQGPDAGALYVLDLACDEGAPFGLKGWPDLSTATAELEQWSRAGFATRNLLSEAPRS